MNLTNRASCCCVALAVWFAAQPVAQRSAGVGVAAIKIPDSVNGGTIHGFVFYP
jgi:hypothetical protein